CADILNEHFVCIKVDREERPDIDKHYQEVHMLLNRRAGGWPTSIFCTPQNKPFFAGTYIPPESEQGSIEGMGFKELTKLIGSKISQNDEQIYKNADEVEGFLNHVEHPKEATVLKEDFTKNFMLQVKNNYDTKYGGFSSAPKFPQANTLGTLLIIDKLYDDKSARAMIENTLKNMTVGGMWDEKDGGFCRYAMDEEWRKPHHEKMLYDNALLCELYTDVYLSYKDEFYLDIAKKTADFCLKQMSEDFLFYSARDADEKDFFDKKIQTSWSSMMIKSLFTLGSIDNMYKNKAIKSLDALLNTMFIDGKLYHTTLIHKTPKVEAFLEDYAFLALALVSAFNSTQDEIYLIHAQHFANMALKEFYKNGTWNFSTGEFKTKADIADNTYTSSVSIMVDVLISLGTLLEDEKYSHFAFKTLEYNSYELGRRPVIYPYMLRQTLRHLKGDRVIKSNISNLELNSFELSSLNYPFIQRKTTDDKDYMICGDKSCFASTDSINKINDIITDTF
ncbi:MAG: thioredoxin domain-containing protein, partial [Sulfurimonas sp.]|nr:thioredoxin domain-containing protein [Sulfurimonas sp.]